MIIADTNYTETLFKIEQLKGLICEIQQATHNQIPQGTTKEIDKSAVIFINTLEEVEVYLIEYDIEKNVRNSRR